MAVQDITAYKRTMAMFLDRLKKSDATYPIEKVYESITQEDVRTFCRYAIDTINELHGTDVEWYYIKTRDDHDPKRMTFEIAIAIPMKPGTKKEYKVISNMYFNLYDFTDLPAHFDSVIKNHSGAYAASIFDGPNLEDKILLRMSWQIFSCLYEAYRTRQNDLNKKQKSLFTNLD